MGLFSYDALSRSLCNIGQHPPLPAGSLLPNPCRTPDTLRPRLSLPARIRQANPYAARMDGIYKSRKLPMLLFQHSRACDQFQLTL
jgi:hypothetical protein